VHEARGLVGGDPGLGAVRRDRDVVRFGRAGQADARRFHEALPYRSRGV